jgi:sucrose-6-phosphate hydrolase SacC (GH32 family)
MKPTKTLPLLALLAPLFCLASAAAQHSVVALGFDEPGLAGLPAGVTIHTQFPAPDQVPGVTGSAWRTDGFSSWAAISADLSAGSGFTLMTWIALESYPSDLEVPVDRLSPSSIAQQRDGSRGFDLFIDTYGRWGLTVATSRGEVRVDAPDRFPLYQWVHVAAAVSADEATVFLNGDAVATEDLRRNSTVEFADKDLVLARSDKDVGFLNFTFNLLNAAYDDFAVFDHALSGTEVRDLYGAYADANPDAEATLVVPESRFAGDHHRPVLRAMPPANWTNEPHGLVRFGDTWHLFYQRTPNGPYKTQMHWGHMASDDLVTWRHLPDALWPELQDDKFGFDQKGIWSGDVIVDGDAAYAFYTSVNHFHRLTASNPGVSMAVSTDPDLRNWKKLGPIVNTEYVNDFRDPYLWKEGNSWHMIIGAALDSGGGLDYFVLEPGEGGSRWVHRDRFLSVSYRLLDYGSIIWEMPVFEPLTDDVHVLVVNPIGGRASKYGDPATRAVYWTGEWRDGRFHPFDNEPKMLDVIPGHLAPTVARADDGQLRAIGIVDERRTPQSQEDAGWAHTYSLPRSWSLMADGRTMGQAPAPELLALRGDAVVTSGAQRIEATPLSLVDGVHAYEMEIEVDEIAPGSVLVLDLLVSPDRQEYTRLSFDTSSNEVSLDLAQSTLSSEREGPDVVSGSFDANAFGRIQTIRVFADGSVVDVFINDAAAFAFRAYPERADSTGVQILASKGSASLSGVTVWPLRKPMK